MGTKSQDTFMFQGCVCSLWVRCRCVAWVQQRVTTQTGCGSVRVCGWEGKKLRLSPALRCILRARRTFWRWAAGDLCGSDWTETVRLTEACTLTDSSLNALFTFVCVWQNKGEACLVSVRQYLVARSVERPLALETHGTHLNFDLIHAKYWPCN